MIYVVMVVLLLHKYVTYCIYPMHFVSRFLSRNKMPRSDHLEDSPVPAHLAVVGSARFIYQEAFFERSPFRTKSNSTTPSNSETPLQQLMSRIQKLQSRIQKLNSQVSECNSAVSESHLSSFRKQRFKFPNASFRIQR